MIYDPLSDQHFRSLSNLEGVTVLVDQYARLNADFLVADLTALSSFVELRRGLEALKDHHRVLETLATERAVERRAS